MNKKIIYTMVMILFIFCNALDAMYNKILVTMQLGAAGILIGNGINKSIKIYQEKKTDLIGVPMPRKSQHFIRSVLRTCNHPQAESLPLLMSRDFGIWCSQSDKALCASIDDVLELELSLRKNDTESKNYIDFASMAIKHETYHNMHKDLQCLLYASTLIPITTEGIFFLLRTATKKLCKIKPPKKIISTCVRSSIVLMAFELKLRLNKLSLLLYRQQLERNADKFACEHAETQQELEEFCKYFINDEIYFQQSLKNEHDIDVSCLSLRERYWASKFLYFFEDPLHPCPMDRVLMTIEYLDKWNEEHKN